MLEKIGEVEWSLWHLRSELIGWKEKIYFMLNMVDGGLDLMMCLGQKMGALELNENNQRRSLGRVKKAKEVGWLEAQLPVLLFGGPINRGSYRDVLAC